MPLIFNILYQQDYDAPTLLSSLMLFAIQFTYSVRFLNLNGGLIQNRGRQAAKAQY